MTATVPLRALLLVSSLILVPSAQACPTTAPAPTADRGDTVARVGELLAIGLPHDDRHGEDAGATCLYELVDGTWTLSGELELPREAGDLFGSAVAMTGDRLLVGAMGATDDDGRTGSAHLFVRTASSWTHEHRLRPDDLRDGDHFGWSVALSEDLAVVGAPLADRAGNGVAHVFRNDGSGWTASRLLTSTSDDLLFVGNAITMDDTSIVVQAESIESGTDTVELLFDRGADAHARLRMLD
ncbi:MAG: FG-GAP repeat protein [Acidobacteriota bacterium]